MLTSFPTAVATNELMTPRNSHAAVVSYKTAMPTILCPVVVSRVPPIATQSLTDTATLTSTTFRVSLRAVEMSSDLIPLVLPRVVGVRPPTHFSRWAIFRFLTAAKVVPCMPSMSTPLPIGVAMGTPLLSSASYASEAIRKSIVSTASQIAKGMLPHNHGKV
jgi:hypothetical protein